MFEEWWLHFVCWATEQGIVSLGPTAAHVAAFLHQHGISAWPWKYCLRRLINPAPGVPQALYFQDGLPPNNDVGRKMLCTSGISVQHQTLPI